MKTEKKRERNPCSDPWRAGTSPLHRHFEENSQVDPIHSPSEATSAPFHPDATVPWLDHLSQDFKALLSFSYINSKARPSDFSLEHYQNSTGVSLCWPLGPFAFQGGDCLCFPKGIALQPDTTKWQLVSPHSTCQQGGQLRSNSQEYMAPATPPHKPPIRIQNRKTNLMRIWGFLWMPSPQM